MKYTIEEIGWVCEDEIQEQTLSGEINGIPFDVTGIDEDQIKPIIEQLMYASSSDCETETKTKKAIQRKIKVTVEIEDVLKG